MSTILEALAVIKGKDATGNAFDSVASKIKRISRAANAVNRDVEKQLATAGRVETAVTRMSRASTMIGHGARAAAGAAAAYEGSRAARAIVEHTAKAASDRQHEEVRMSASGMSNSEIKEAGELAGKMSAKYKSLSQTEIMHTARNIRSVVGNFEEATHILDPLMKLRVVAEGAHPERKAELGDDFDKLIKGMEIKGVTQDLGKFNHYIDGMAKALNVFGDTLRPTDYYEMFKYGRAATNALSDDFMLKTAPTLAQELGGSSAGKALSSFYTQFVGGKMSNKAVAQLAQYDMLDPSKVIKTKTGNVKGVLPGGIIGSEYLQPGKTDPYGWVQNVLLPHLAKKGITDQAQIQEVIAAMSSQTTTAQMMSIFALQKSRIEKDWNLVHGADGIAAADKFLKHDPKVAASAVMAQTENVLSGAGQFAMPGALKGMDWLSNGLSYFSENAAPSQKAGAVGFASMLGAALSLDGALSMFNSWKARSLTGSLSATRLTGILAPIIDIASRPDVLDPERFRKFAPLHADKLSALSDLDRSDSLLPHARSGSRLGNYVASIRAGHDAERAKTEAELRDLGFAGPDAPGRGMMAGQYSIEDVRKAIGFGGAGEPAKAEVVGNATLETTVTVSPSPDFLTRVEQTISNAINAFRSSGGPATGTTGSTGTRMPEATAPM